MDDLISRQEAMELCGEKLIDMKANPDFYDDAISHYGGSRYNDGVNTCIDVIEELPSAQQEQKTGRWIPFYEGSFVCSKCKRDYKVDTYMGEPLWNYCPNCGAKMEGLK